MILVFLGPPGSGKGTQAKRLERDKKLPQLSTGDMLRAAISAGTELGKEAKKFMDKGDLVPDSVVIGLISERMQQSDAKNGFVLDGFPRNIAQADALAAELQKNGKQVDLVPFFDVADEAVVERLSGRRSCSNCGALYHVKFSPPKKEGSCDKCGQDLFQRDDDREDVIRNRLTVYRKQTEPLVDYYEKKGLLRHLDAAADPDDVYKELLRLI